MLLLYTSYTKLQSVRHQMKKVYLYRHFVKKFVSGVSKLLKQHSLRFEKYRFNEVTKPNPFKAYQIDVNSVGK